MANKKYTDLAAAGALAGTDVIAVARGAASLQTPLSAVQTLVLPAVVTEAGTSRTALPAHAGNYTRFTAGTAKTYTFDNAQAYVVGTEFHVRNVGAGNLTLTPAGGFTFTAPYNGTLVVPPAGVVTIKIVGSGAADVFGVTV